MSSRGALKVVKKFKAAHQKPIRHGPLSTHIPAGQASGSPPLGTQLGQRGVNIPSFIKDFNERTKHYKPGTPLVCRVYVKPDRSYQIAIWNPPFPYFIKHAAGISRGAMEPFKEITGMITLKHAYEIAKIKSQDIMYQAMTLPQVVNLVVDTARTVGVKVVRDLNPDDYAKFLEERKTIVAEQKQKLQEKREARMLRTSG